jgi:putative addiction module component (TIGR02574 family)
MTHNEVMDTVLPLDRMTVEEKFRAIEMLWDDLCRNEKQLPVADWQKQLLDDREQQIQTGEAKFSDWDAAKKRIRERTS